MPETLITDFHFLRPEWLWALVPILLLYVVLARRSDPRRRWQAVIEPHLLEHLLVDAGHGPRLRPIHLVTVVTLLATLGMAGPTWAREESPFAEDTAPLVVALDLSSSMNAVDVQPTRLERAKQKLRDLLALRAGARTALIAYAGSAHIVLPLSTDPSMFEAFIDGLDSSVMPVEGKDPASALLLADSLLQRDSVPGSILFLTDGISADAVPDFAAHEAATRDAVLVLAFGTSEGGAIRDGDGGFVQGPSGGPLIATLDRDGLDALAAGTSAFVAGATVDARDVERLQRRIQSNLHRARQDDPTARWRDDGYWLLYPIVLLALLWFRKGWTVRWGAVAVVATLTGCAPADGRDFRFVDLWLTSDQQGRRLYEAGDFAGAAERFADPAWRGTALYRAGDLEGAIAAWASLDTPESSFGIGNAQALLGQYPLAVAGYERALVLRPGWPEAIENRDFVASLIPPPPDEEESGDPAPPPNLGADDVEFDNDENRGERGEVPQSLVSDEQMAELWLRRLQTSPADFLRRRFLIEQALRTGPGGGG